MKKTLLTIVALAFLLITIGSSAQTATPPTVGDGSSDNPYEVATLENLYWIAEDDSRWGYHYLQTADIDASATVSWSDGEGWEPIGSYISWDNNSPFSGAYNGAGFVIDGLFINRPEDNRQGLFGYVRGAVLRNIALDNVSINGNSYVGAIAGWVDEVLLEGIFASGTINGTSFIGGLLGVMSVDSKLYFGHNECVVNANGDYAGGITGNLSMAYIYDSYSDAGAVTGNSYVGGIAGFTGMSSIRRSYNISDVNGINNVGGLVGYSQDYDNISSSFNEGNVTGLLKVGGVVGAAGDGSNFSNLYNKGVVSGESEVAGIIGWAGSAITISNCYNVGLTIGDLNTNGILGYVEGSGNSINNSYWNVETTDQSSGGGAGAVELSTEQMKMQASYNTWDFADIWGILEGVSYPFFKWQKVAIEIIKEGNGTIIPEGQVLVTVGEDLTLSITPEIGSYLFSIEINGSIIDLEVDPSWDANNGVLTLTSIQESQSVHITFTPYTYTITYHADGGTHANPENFTIEDLDITLTDATKDGYAFLGWFGNAELTGEAVTQITEIGDVELWASFEAIEYTFTYHADGGNHTNPATFTIEDLDITLADATKDGYTFAGWFNNAELTGEAVTQITEIGDVELWAKFEAIIYNITYHADGGTHANPATFTIEDLDITLANATKDGYTFAGWFGNAELTGEAVTQITEIGDVELWASFEVIEYTITYHADGGTHANPENFTIEDLDITLVDATKNGYTFAGWFDNAELTGDAVTQITEIGNVELWAKFEAIVYNITYHADGGTHANPATFTIEDLDITLSDATKDGYTFAGWFNNAELTGNAVTQITEIGNVELWAGFEVIEYIITASTGDNGGISPEGNVVVEHGNSQSFVITPNEGYVIATLSVDGNQINLENDENWDAETLTYEFVSVTSNHTVHVEFDTASATTFTQDVKPRAYPNPFSNHISISDAEGNERVVITNIAGQRVVDIFLNGNTTISTSTLKSGVYILSITNSKGDTFVSRIVKN